MKGRLNASDKKMAELVSDVAIVGEVDGSEYAIIPIAELMELIRKVCLDEFTEDELSNIKEIFRQLGSAEHVFVESLLNFFGELPESKSSRDDRLNTAEKAAENKSIAELSEASIQAIAQLANYIHENKLELNDFLSESIFKMTFKVDDKEIEVDSIRLNSLLALLKKADLLPYDEDEYKDLSECLCIENDMIPVNRLQEVIKLVEGNFVPKTDKKAKESANNELLIENKSEESNIAKTINQSNRENPISGEEAANNAESKEDDIPVSYTHLTLPTICSV
eukprot:TRINITY_DN4066_c0_g1_i1.p1 TRINITY_DN4066_c0_g1~~TRINITY_DN4066_c0_g1_i1.p1  ORF type:complete len:280 (+),score=64.21 TRINITY_DN4066_c0_g1_i1:436-1275(+)